MLKVIKIIKKAGQAALLYYNKKLKIASKENNSPVTEADLASNKIICEELRKYEYGILSEEEKDDSSRLNKDRVWIIDPLDGTKDFIEKTGEFSIMIGLVEKTKNGDFKPILGVVYKPIGDIAYYAMKNQGAFKQIGREDPIKLKVSKENNFNKINFFESRFHPSPDLKKMAVDLGIRNFISCGSAGLKLSYIAERKADLNINTSNHTYEWDLCAADIVLSEAGGRLSDVSGNEFSYNKKDPRNYEGYVASNGLIHNKVIKYLNEDN